MLEEISVCILHPSKFTTLIIKSVDFSAEVRISGDTTFICFSASLAFLRCLVRSSLACQFLLDMLERELLQEWLMQVIKAS